jgi:hypothetical protein
MTITSKTRKQLWGCAANMCAFPGCDAIDSASDGLQPGSAVKLEECHIVARKTTGPRGNSNMSSAERDQYDNLILLCPIHHKIIDDQPDIYTVEELQSIKVAHEQRIRESLAQTSLQLIANIQRPAPDELLTTQLIAALDEEAYTRVRAILKAVISTLSDARPWTSQHSNLLFDVGFALWNEGEPGSSIIRTARIQPMLDLMRQEFVSGVTRKIWSHVVRLKSSDAVDRFCEVLAELIQDTADEGFIRTVGSVVESLSRFDDETVPTQGMLELGNSLGIVHPKRPEDKMYQDWIDALIIHVGAALLAMGGEENMARHLMNNGFAYVRKPKSVRFAEYANIDSESYDRALKLIGIKRFKQI